jgi:hypothetical protein
LNASYEDGSREEPSVEDCPEPFSPEKKTHFQLQTTLKASTANTDNEPKNIQRKAVLAD